MELIITILAVAALALVFYLLFKVFKFITRLILVIIFLALAYITNPSLVRHEAAVRTKSEKDGTSLEGWTVTVTDLKVASITRLTQDDSNKAVGVGAFTRVWIFRAVP
ncbi:hypothetical protein KK062_18615 [Fulvivirgaceae bacterium PWU5]|uniref:Uncharacterized protein n=1 Tax=Dawidia cretensis TaxID=2782350 RepID=A0AAP2E242_9BACT|nr:hypothetical protein [Dawidia cretensis]MBT1710267.1 hypothetical protein [Dawidia cretensis]